MRFGEIRRFLRGAGTGPATPERRAGRRGRDAPENRVLLPAVHHRRGSGHRARPGALARWGALSPSLAHLRRRGGVAGDPGSPRRRGRGRPEKEAAARAAASEWTRQDRVDRSTVPCFHRSNRDSPTAGDGSTDCFRVADIQKHSPEEMGLDRFPSGTVQSSPPHRRYCACVAPNPKSRSVNSRRRDGGDYLFLLAKKLRHL